MSKSGFDYSEFEKYSRNFTRMTNEYNSWIKQFITSEGMRFIAGVKRRTPVDTGDLRDHWQLDGITRSGNELHCWFVNSMNYATFVEYGHAKPYKAGAAEGSPDWVQGSFMMTVTLDEIYKKMPARFNASFRKFLDSMEVL